MSTFSMSVAASPSQAGFCGQYRASLPVLSPGIVDLATNAIAVRQIEEKTRKIIRLLKSRYPETGIHLNPAWTMSTAAMMISGSAGKFRTVMALLDSLKHMKPAFPNLHVELGPVISRPNVD